MMGWEHVLRGRLVNSWFLAHDLYIQQRHFKSAYSSQVFGPHLIRALFSLSLQTWNHRNQLYCSNNYGIFCAEKASA